MTARDELASIVDDRWHGYGYNPQGIADAILAAGYRKPRVVESVEELDALPVDSLLLSCSKYPSYAGTVWRVSSGGMIEKVGREVEGVTPVRYFKDPLPATVLHEGAAK